MAKKIHPITLNEEFERYCEMKGKTLTKMLPIFVETVYSIHINYCTSKV